MINLGKRKVKIDFPFDIGPLGENRIVKFNNTSFRIARGSMGFFAQGLGSHVEATGSLNDILRKKGESLHTLANKSTGYTGNGIFPEFKTLEDLRNFINKVVKILKECTHS